MPKISPKTCYTPISFSPSLLSRDLSFVVGLCYFHPFLFLWTTYPSRHPKVRCSVILCLLQICIMFSYCMHPFCSLPVVPFNADAIRTIQPRCSQGETLVSRCLESPQQLLQLSQRIVLQGDPGIRVRSVYHFGSRLSAFSQYL